MLETITADRVRRTVEALAGFETRHTLSRLDQPRRGIGAAREWIRAEMAAASPRLQVAFDAYDVPAQGERITRDVDLRNVVAVNDERLRAMYVVPERVKDEVVRLPGSVRSMMNARRRAVDHGVISIVGRERGRVLRVEGLLASREHGGDLLARHF